MSMSGIVITGILVLGMITQNFATLPAEKPDAGEQFHGMTDYFSENGFCEDGYEFPDFYAGAKVSEDGKTLTVYVIDDSDEVKELIAKATGNPEITIVRVANSYNALAEAKDKIFEAFSAPSDDRGFVVKSASVNIGENRVDVTLSKDSDAHAAAGRIAGIAINVPVNFEVENPYAFLNYSTEDDFLSYQTWYDYFMSENDRMLYELDLDPADGKMTWKIGYFESEWKNTFSGAYTKDDSGVYHGSLYDEIRDVRLDVDFTLEITKVSYGNGELIFTLNDVSLERYKPLIGKAIKFTQNSAPDYPA